MESRQQAAGAPGGTMSVPDIVAEPMEDLTEILGRIRAHRSSRIVLDYAEHRFLRQHGHLRRLLVAAAADLGKTVEFALPDSAGPTRSVHPSLASRSPVRTPVATWRHVSLASREFAASGLTGRGSLGIHRSQRPLSATARAGPLSALVDFFGNTRALTLFAFVAGLLLTGVILFVLPAARVTLVLASEPLVADLSFEISSEAAVQNPTALQKSSPLRPSGFAGQAAGQGSAVLPVRLLVFEEMVEGEFPVETVVETGERARGQVALVNRADSPQGIKAGTRLEGDGGVVLRTERDAIIPALGRAAVPVRAERGGTAGNLSHGRLSLPALPAASRRVIYGEVFEPLAAGTDRSVRQLAPGDVSRGVEKLKSMAEDGLRGRLRAEMGEPQVTQFERSELRRVRVTNERSSVPVGTDAESFRLQASIRAETFAVEEERLRQFLHDLVQSQSGGGGRGGEQGAEKRQTLAKEIPLADLRVVDVRWDEGRAELSLHVETTLVPAVDIENLKEQLVGRSTTDAEAFLRHRAGIRSASVVLSPVWVKEVPRNRRNITVIQETSDGAPLRGIDSRNP